jgi:peptidyl-prolyl cis-trans isomerase SurA
MLRPTGMTVLLALLLSGAAWAAPTAIAPAEAPTSAELPERQSPTDGVLADRVVATVNDDVILLSEVYAFDTYIEEQAQSGTRAAAEREVVDRILQQRLIGQEVARLHLEVTDAEIDRNIDDISQRNGLEREQLRAEVEKEMTWTAYRAELAKGLQEMKFAQSVLRPRINITEDELKDAFIRTTQDAPKVARVQAIFLSWPVSTDEAAKAVAAQAVRAKAQAIITEAATADFAALSKKYDEGPFGAQNGEMGKFKEGELVGGLDAAMRATATGAVSAPVETPQGIFLLKVAERTAGATDFETLRPKLEEAVFESRMADEELRWFEQAKRQAAIRILL